MSVTFFIKLLVFLFSGWMFFGTLLAIYSGDPHAVPFLLFAILPGLIVGSVIFAVRFVGRVFLTQKNRPSNLAAH